MRPAESRSRTARQGRERDPMTSTAIDPLTVDLQREYQETREDGVDFMQAVSWYAGEPHTDDPECADPEVAIYCRTLNHVIPDKYRNSMLRPMVEMVANSRAEWPLATAYRRDYIATRILSFAVQIELETAGYDDYAAYLRQMDERREVAHRHLDVLHSILETSFIRKAAKGRHSAHRVLVETEKAVKQIEERLSQEAGCEYVPRHFMMVNAAFELPTLAVNGELAGWEEDRVWKRAVSLIEQVLTPDATSRER